MSQRKPETGQDGEPAGEARRIERWRTAIAQHRAELLRLHRAGASGLEVCQRNARFFDSLLGEVFGFVRGAAEPALALCATGSLGRGELAPYSDIDLCFLAPEPIESSVGELVHEVIRILWDAGVEVSHALRTPAEFLDLARHDPTVRTTILDLRHLAGDPTLLPALLSQFEDLVRAGAIDPEVTRKRNNAGLAESGYPHESIAVLEPDLKESPGALRDYQVALWTARMRGLGREPEALERAGVIDERTRIDLGVAVDFLLRLRNEIQFARRKKADMLAVEIQEEVAGNLGYVAAGREQAIEALLRDYYQSAAVVFRFANGVVEHAGDGGGSSRTLALVRVEKGLLSDGVRLYLARPDAVAKDPSLVLRFFRVAAERGLAPSNEARRQMRASRYVIDDALRESREAAAEFHALLACDRAAPALRWMHELGVLGDYLPEFGALYHLAQYDVYHRFTVDEHTLLALHFLEDLLETEDPALATLADLYRRVPDREAIKLALLFHDMGKAGGPGHLDRGLRLIPLIAHRLGLDRQRTEQIRLLVRHHMLMNELALKRDIHDRAVVKDFVSLVRDMDHLDRLYLVSYADMKAVGPGVWTPWKAALLEELYQRARRELGRAPGESDAEIYRGLREECLRSFEGQADAEAVRRYLDRLPDRLLTWLDPTRIRRHLAALERFGPRPCEVLAFREERVGYLELLVCSRDRAGLFSRLAGVVTAQGLNILGAQAFSLTDGTVLDTLQVLPIHEEDVRTPDLIAEAVRRDLTEVLEGRRDVADLIEKRPRYFRKRRAQPHFPTAVRVDNDLSDTHTVVEVIARDRPGLLYAITDPIRELGLNISLAKINTEAARVVDVFYLTRAGGGKIEDRLVLAELAARLRAAIENGAGERAP